LFNWLDRIAVHEIEIIRLADPDGTGIDVQVADFAGLDIGKGTDDAVPHGGQVHRGKGPQVTAVGRGSVDVGVVGRDGVPDKKRSRVSGSWEKLCTRVLIRKLSSIRISSSRVHRDIELLILEQVPFFFNSSPGCRFCTAASWSPAAAQEIAAGKVGVLELTRFRGWWGVMP
jgi:hypothetical protein